ncbi:MAG: DNA-protecting protein DprA [Clostridiales bacterium]|nr:DNA-protecting protein DprA [Clostridiales bacterium]
MDKRDLLIVFLSQFDLSSKKMSEIMDTMKEQTIKCFSKTKFAENILKKETYESMIASADEALVQTYLKNLADRDISVLTIYSDEYPNRLREQKDAPLILYCKGDVSLLNKECLSVVGTRKPSSYGKMATEKLVRDVAGAGVVIVSGLAYGIDSIAHRCALECGGKTIAVLGGGFDHIYPTEHQSLADEIARKGLLISEQRPKKLSSKYLFPLRNRIIAGISQATLITEASIKSGTIHTKDFALEYGNDVYAVPGNIDSSSSELTNEVIKTGQGKCVTCGKDILDDYEINLDKQVVQIELQPDEEKIVNLLKDGMKKIDFLTKNSGLDINNFNTCLTMLEIRGIISRLPGGTIALK